MGRKGEGRPVASGVLGKGSGGARLTSQDVADGRWFPIDSDDVSCTIDTECVCVRVCACVCVIDKNDMQMKTDMYLLFLMFNVA